jgi:ABC-type ATPase involved in cell division
LRKTQIDKDDPRGFLLMLGASGSGKSSLARAGVMPALVEPGVIDGIGLWRRALMKPSDAQSNVFLALAQALLNESALPELALYGTTAEGLMERFSNGEPSAVTEKIESGLLIASERERARQEVEINELIHKYRIEDRHADAESLQARLSRLAPPRACIALLIDQLDEIFTGDVSPANRAAFIEAMAALARSGFAVVLTTLRSDFYHRLAEFPILLELAQGTASYHLAAPHSLRLARLLNRLRSPDCALTSILRHGSRLMKRSATRPLRILRSYPCWSLRWRNFIFVRHGAETEFCDGKTTRPSTGWKGSLPIRQMNV